MCPLKDGEGTSEGAVLERKLGNNTGIGAKPNEIATSGGQKQLNVCSFI